MILGSLTMRPDKDGFVVGFHARHIGTKASLDWNPDLPVENHNPPAVPPDGSGAYSGCRPAFLAALFLHTRAKGFLTYGLPNVS